MGGEEVEEVGGKGNREMGSSWLHARTARLNLQCDFNLSSKIVLFPSVKKRKIDPRCSHRSAQSFKRAHRLSQNQQDDCKMSPPECAKYAPMWTRKDMGDH